MSFKRQMIGLGLTLVCGTSASAHDIYSQLTNKWGSSCCNSSDCRPAPYRVTREGVEMRVDDGWVYVPLGMIQYRLLDGDTGSTGGGHWCGELYEGTFITYCAFLPPDLASVSAAPRETAEP